MNLLQRTFDFIQGARQVLAKALVPLETGPGSERGARPTPENEVKYLYSLMQVDPELRQAILHIREMDRLDGRVKRIHGRVARDTVKGGLILQQSTESQALAKEWIDFGRRLQLNRAAKLRSDARALVMEGNLPLQVVLDDKFRVAAAVRMPSETIVPNVHPNGRFKDLTRAYTQFDVMNGRERASFALWQLHLCRLDPDNYDDMGSMGRPFLDANRTLWQKLRMTDEDLVIRRRVRAPLRLAHVLEGAQKSDLDDYRAAVEKDQGQITTDYFLNKKGSVTPVQGDANLDHMKDIVYLLDSFFAGTPVPKGLMGFTEGLARDVLEDMKRDYYEEIDGIQDEQAFAYEWLFRFHLLLKGINPDAEEFSIVFAERRTETPNQTADRALKMRALNFPEGLIWEEMGYNAAAVRARRDWELENTDPYPDPNAITPLGGARVSITPGNQRKGESGTAIKNK